MGELPFLGVNYLADIDSYAHEDTSHYQFFVAEETSLVEAIAIQTRMRAGNPGVAFKVFNPELVARKAEAEAAVREALEAMQDGINSAALELAATRQTIASVQAKIDLGPFAVRVGPSINHRALPFNQIIYPTNVEIPQAVEGATTVRRLSKRAKLGSRMADGRSQICFWRFNLAALRAKEAAQVAYLKALSDSRDELAGSVLHEKTRLGSGYSDYAFQY
ncbi:hypothetical protein BS78_03G047500 [Paspalum vaginatum]|nr:hypothetical protein BS78_03G047500 [Paspalum vaginatum]KAJ1282379.1 hypothetical protein BS78_03G047500 [Paspalum vaginatum]